MPSIEFDNDSVRASRAGHTFHERWAARRALQLLFPSDGLSAIAVEGISHTETGHPGQRAEEVADLVFYYGSGDNFENCSKLETVQFKYKNDEEPVTAAYLKKTIEKFADTIVGYDNEFSAEVVDAKASFIFVTNTPFSASLWEAIAAIIDGKTPSNFGAKIQTQNLRRWCEDRKLADPARLFSRTVFKAGEEGLAAQEGALKRTLTDWSVSEDTEAKARLFEVQNLIVRKAGPSGQRNNLIRREDILNALGCEVEDLFPAEKCFATIGQIIEREELSAAGSLVKSSSPVFVYADGGVGKTVFVQSFAAMMANEFEVVVFDCFGGGSYRSDNHSRHLPRIGLTQIVNELALKTLCDPILPSGDDSRKIVRTARRRLAQAAKAVRTQSKKHGLLIIIDAADNAQLEANSRSEQSFAKLLLEAVDEEPIEGVSLLLTARPYRRASVIGHTRVTELELGPFTEEEAREFLAVRKPDASDIEITTALTRSGRNARVLDYLVKTWDINVVAGDTTAEITVPDIIAQHCDKIIGELRIAGWCDAEVVEFFAAISLLPPPIPLDELALALSWSISQVKTAASDLAPFLDMTSHGVIFRDEPTETYVKETYSQQSVVQRAIADRLLAAQSNSAYAAEALPHFLVIIKDSERAFALAESTSFPSSVQSDFGKRRLVLARLRSAFRLATDEGDFDRLIGLSMRLAQITTANLRGDEFIRRSPELAILLGDADSYRRLVADRTGWRGAKSARLTIAHQFAGDREEAEIQCDSTVRWINWHVEQPKDETIPNAPGPGATDYVAILLHKIVGGDFEFVDRNLCRWNDRFSLSVCAELIQLVELFDLKILEQLAAFAESDKCQSKMLKLRLLSHPLMLSRKQIRRLATGIGTLSPIKDDNRDNFSLQPPKNSSGEIVDAALTTLIYSSRKSAANILGSLIVDRPSSYDYGEHHAYSRAWGPIRYAAIRAWSSGKSLKFHHLLPRDVKIDKNARSVSTKDEAKAFLKSLTEPKPAHMLKKGETKGLRAKFSDREVAEISGGIECALSLLQPIEEAVLSRKGITDATVMTFMSLWSELLRNDAHWQAGRSVDLLARTVGIGCLNILLTHGHSIAAPQAEAIVELLSSGRFYISQKIGVLAELARKSELHEVAGTFAQKIAEEIQSDDNIDHRGTSYADLAFALMPMSVDEAREYYRQGLAQLDQMGGESYEQIYSLLHFAAAQKGGFVAPQLGQRLMNLCQTIVSNEPSKFGWTLFARAAAKSIGFPAITKLVRWHNQDVAKLSYGLPQLACFLAENGHLDRRRAAFILTICEDHGWYDWQSGDAVLQLLQKSTPKDQRNIFFTVLENLKIKHSVDGWPSLWKSYLRTASKFPDLITPSDEAEIEALWAEAQKRQDEFNGRYSSSPDFSASQNSDPTEADIDKRISEFVTNCDLSSAPSIDSALKEIRLEDNLPFNVWQRFILALRAVCPYSKRLSFILAIIDATEIGYSQSLNIVSECIAAWKASSAHLVAQTEMLAKRLFEAKGVELFEEQFSNLSHEISLLSDFCGDGQLVLELFIRKVAANEVELDGDQWLQIATALCNVASEAASLEALEFILGGPASRIADEIGEGPLRPDQLLCGNEEDLFADVLWHLLGDSDAYIRWTIARGVSDLIRLGLLTDISNLLSRFDVRSVPALASTDHLLAFQNSQQWLLIGLARTTWLDHSALQGLRAKLLQLAKRDDIHVLHKTHIMRALRNIDGGLDDAELAALQVAIDEPPFGVVVSDSYASGPGPTTTFAFDYDFTKTEIAPLARLFNLPQSSVVEAMGCEITRLWPEAASMKFFPGQSRYRWELDDQYEFYREHIQKHALLSAATTLSKSFPMVIRHYEVDEESPWLSWRNRYDITFDDGSWLSDRKDAVPDQANETFLGKGNDRQHTLQSQEAILHKLGLGDTTESEFLPIYGRWTSPDGVTVNITSALTDQKGAIGRCTNFAKRSSGDFWLPEFWEEGFYDRHHRQENPFNPFIWAPERRGLGIDVGDELAAEGAAIRPRLGIDLTATLGLIQRSSVADWIDAGENIALRSQVWGGWKPNPDDVRYRHQDNGEILWASSSWLDTALAKLKQRLVFTITLWKYKSSRDYDDVAGVKYVLVGLLQKDGSLRIWNAKKASNQDY
ncbi:NACHT domain-containing protein [Cohaesibacter gelatinilyticus]|uniref:NACHT domain-containing protein n=1 Tax=Cohaesibacter gelatinilyticus TaxID=372072 RepID=A0A285PHX7_9HYPH|nr:NACHT domain-containing protein [Cohaesibacter gelatinilyticus]SNZ21324.1 NACHT domain-containing protein [Cohaesibacter gelatinilyticus]